MRRPHARGDGGKKPTDSREMRVRRTERMKGNHVVLSIPRRRRAVKPVRATAGDAPQALRADGRAGAADAALAENQGGGITGKEFRSPPLQKRRRGRRNPLSSITSETMRHARLSALQRRHPSHSSSLMEAAPCSDSYAVRAYRRTCTEINAFRGASDAMGGGARTRSAGGRPGDAHDGGRSMTPTGRRRPGATAGAPTGAASAGGP